MGKLICKYCGDPILSFQEKTMIEGMHEGCYELSRAYELEPHITVGDDGGQNETTRN